MPDPSDSSKVSVPPIDPERLAALRSRAASRLTGIATAQGAASSASDALSVLHALASSPDTAADALALLHELQVHQVELDLQAQELRDSRAALESDLRRYVELYERQPVASFTIDARLVVHELNRTAGSMLGIDRDDALGQALDVFFRPEGARRFRAALASADAGPLRKTCRLTLCPRDGAERPVLASIAVDATPDRYLVNLTDAVDDEQGSNATRT